MTSVGKQTFSEVHVWVKSKPQPNWRRRQIWPPDRIGQVIGHSLIGRTDYSNQSGNRANRVIGETIKTKMEKEWVAGLA